LELNYQKVLEGCHYNPDLAEKICKILDVPDIPTTKLVSHRFSELLYLVDNDLAPIFLSDNDYKKLVGEMAEIAETTQEITSAFKFAVIHLTDDVQLDLLKRMAEKAVYFREITMGYLMSSLRPSHAESNATFWKKLVNVGTAEDWYVTMLEYQIGTNDPHFKKFANQLALSIEREAAKI
jgi:hypothetical protein